MIGATMTPNRRFFPSFLIPMMVLAMGLHSAAAQPADRWSIQRSIIPRDMEATEANVVIQSDGSLNVTFRGGSIENPELGGIYFSRSVNQGYSWSRPEPAISLAGIVTGVTHQLQSDGDNLLLYAAVNRLARFEVPQFLSQDRGRTWRENEVVFSSVDPIRGLLSWKSPGRMFIFVLTTRNRPTGESEHTFWLVQGRGSGAYWETPVRIRNFFANSVSSPQLVPPDFGEWPAVYWRENGFQDNLLEVSDNTGATWRVRPLNAPPEKRGGGLMEDQGVFYRVETTQDRRLLFNRTDDELPRTNLISTIPSELDADFLRVVWQGEDNYTLPSFLRFEVQLDEADPVVLDATSYQFEGLVNGSHRISIAAIDEARNRQVPATVRTFRVQVPPVPSFTAPETGALLNSGTVTATWEGKHNAGPDAPLLFSLKVNDGDWGEWTTETEAVVEGLGDGDHAFFLRAKDSFENVSRDFAEARFEVDSEPPVSVAEELPRNWEELQPIWPDLPNYKVDFRVTGRDNRTPGSALEYRFRLNDAAPGAWMKMDEIASLTGLADGMHKIEFETKDEAGNIQAAPTTLDFDFNTPPNTHLWVDDTNPAGRTYRFQGKDSNTNLVDMMFRWKIGEDGEWSEWTLETQVLAADILQGVPHGEHVLYLQARDAAGNVDPTPAREIIEVDTIPPDPPTGVKISTSGDGSNVDLRWESVSEAGVNYQVYRTKGGDPNFDRSKAASVYLGPNTRTRDIPGREEDEVDLHYFVTSIDRSGNESEPGEVQSIKILGNIQIRETQFNNYKRNVDAMVGGKRWAEVQRAAAEADPEIVPAAYTNFWKAVASAGTALSMDPQNLDQLIGARSGIDGILQSNPNEEMRGSLDALSEELRSAILWIRLKTYGLYGAIVLVVLLVVFGVYRYLQNKKVTEMPLIRINEGIPTDITPSKDALKDPTVLRRWAEVQADPKSSENWSRLAFAFHNIGELENAIQSLYKALEIEPENTRFHFQMGHFQKEIGKTRDAIRHFERYLDLNPESTKSAEEVKALLDKLRKESE